MCVCVWIVFITKKVCASIHYMCLCVCVRVVVCKEREKLYIYKKKEKGKIYLIVHITQGSEMTK